MGRFTDFLARLRRGGAELDRERLAALLGLNRALARAGDRKALLTTLLDEAVALFGAERGFLIVPTSSDDDEGPADYRVEVARSLDREAVRSPEKKLSHTLVRGALDGEGAFSEDAREGEFSAVASIADLKLRSVLCMPLTAGDSVVGCIYLDHRFQSRAFSDDDLPWFQAFCDQAAIALHLHDLLDENRRAADAMARQNEALGAQVVAQARELVDLQPAGRSELSGNFDRWIGESPALCRALHLLDRLAPSGLPVLLVGESGTGKELAARALHENGAVAGPFVAVNVAAISASLLESELFGHVRGAFTGAERDRLGLLREADGGVLFLDEVTEMDLDVQVKLLRFLEEGEVRPVGGDSVHRVGVRLVAATNRDPLAEVQAGRFREDLYYRLAAVTVPLPPLRERRGDIQLLAARFLEAVARERGGAPRVLGPGVVDALVGRAWAGNVRQLRNEIWRLDALAVDGTVTVDALSEEPRAGSVQGADLPPGLNLQELESWAIARALERAGGNKAEAARLLGMSRRTLYNRLEKGSGGS